MPTLALPLSLLCAVAVPVSSAGAAVPAFNQGIIIGTSARIPTYGTTGRARQYAVGSWQASMTADGYLITDPEYIAMGLYFDQTPTPQYGWAGVQDLTAISAAGVTANNSGTGYAVGDRFTITRAGASYGVGVVSAIGTGGAVTAFTLFQGGTGYADSTGNATTTTGAGLGLQVDITAIGESPVQAVIACRAAAPAWYTVMVCGSTDTDHVAIASWVQSATPQCQYLYGTQSSNARTGAVGNVFSVIKAAGYSRTHGAFSTIQSGGAPNNAYIAAAVAGRAMGLNTGLANSNFTLDAKTLTGITTEPLSVNEVATICGLPGQGTGINGNAYLNFANSYSFYTQGVNGNGTWFDQILGLDMLAADAQLSVLNVLASLPAIPLTNAGQMQVLNAINGACARAASRGFIAGGVWSGPAVLGLVSGQSLPDGYIVQSDSYTKQTASDRGLRKSMPVYVSVILAGSQQSFTIGINVQQ